MISFSYIYIQLNKIFNSFQKKKKKKLYQKVNEFNVKAR